MSEPLDVLHCDNHLLVVRKPACVPMVADASGDETLVDRARAWVKRELAKPGNVWLGVVHRLDRPVSGVCVLARTSKAAARLSTSFRDGRVEKTYLGVTEGWPEPASAELEQWLVKDRERNRVRVVDAETAGARRARTRWTTLAREERGGARRALVALVPRTGRPHQLRVAMASFRAPLEGDLKYGARAALSDRSIALHARRIELDHPTRGERLVFEAAPPALACWRIAREREGGGPSPR